MPSTGRPGPIIARKLRAIAKNVGDSDVAALKDGSTALIDSLKAAAQADAGGELSHLGRDGTTLGGRYKIVGNRSTVEAVPAGAWAILSSPTRAHFIAPKGSGRKSRRARGRAGEAIAVASIFGGGARRGFRTAGVAGGKVALEFPGGDHAAYAFHPGTRGKKTASRGARAGRPVVDQIIERRFSTAIKKGFLS